MNSYPLELLLQHAPLMFVAGLEAFPLPSSTAPPAPVNGSSEGRVELDPDFSLLAHRLRSTLGALRKPAVWDPERGKEFDVIMVDKNVRFPPRKILPPPPSPQPSDGVPHSPLSPLTPTSPLFPDGLIAPIWVRKHTSLVPSVFVLFLRLWEYRKENEEGVEMDKEREREREREMDIELAKEIAERKRNTAERGIKLTVVLLASRAMLDDSNLDVRLSSLRRAAMLDSRAALFVLSPVLASELVEFVGSLRNALLPVALAYYTNHSKTTRRKRSRPHTHHATLPAAHHGPAVGVAARPLRPEGWAVRYEYKMGVFAEFRGEVELARKHYEDCWSALLDMFSSTAILPPRTKRWAEAKVLADSVSFKIVKLYLYQSFSTAAVRQFRSHLARFTDLSRGWGMGEETVEFWGWAARQYRLLSELLESALVHPIPVVLPSLRPSPSAGLVQAHYAQAPQPGQPLPVYGINPSDALVGPAYWYLCAAECTRERRKRWMGLLENSTDESRTNANMQTEKKVDHQAVIRELYTKAYELFKKQPNSHAEHSRLPFYVAFRVAEAYYEAGEWEMAVRFFERTVKLYKREQWSALLLPILRMWHQCVKHLGDIQAVVQLVLELMAAGHMGLEEDLLAVLKTTSPSSEDAMVIELGGTEVLFDASVVFWATQVFLPEAVPFQLHMLSPSSLDISSLPLSHMRIHFSDDRSPFIVRHRSPDSAASQNSIELGTIGAEGGEAYADLSWHLDEMKVFSGMLAPLSPGELSITTVVPCLAEGSWNIELPFDPNVPRGSSGKGSRWFSAVSNDPQFINLSDARRASVNVLQRPHDFHVDILYHAPAYLNESFPITVEISNVDEQLLHVVMDILLQPSEDEDVNQILIEDQQSSRFIKGVSFGAVKGGETVSKILYVTSTGSAGSRTLDLSIQTWTVSPADTDVVPDRKPSETLRTVTVPIVRPVICTFASVYHRQPRPMQALLEPDASPTLSDNSATSMEATLLATLSCAGPWPVIVHGVDLVVSEADAGFAHLKATSIGANDIWPNQLESGDIFQSTFDFSISAADSENFDPEAPSYGPSPGHLEVRWHRSHSSNDETVHTTSIPLPSILAPPDGIVAVVYPPPLAYLHAPFTLRLTVHNYRLTYAVELSVQTSSSESFAVSGPRRARVAALQYGTAVEILFKLYPLVSGTVVLPPISVFHRQAAADISVDDVETSPVEAPRLSMDGETRWEVRGGRSAPLLVADRADPERAAIEPPMDGVSVIVAPYSQE